MTDGSPWGATAAPLPAQDPAGGAAGGQLEAAEGPRRLLADEQVFVAWQRQLLQQAAAAVHALDAEAVGPDGALEPIAVIRSLHRHLAQWPQIEPAAVRVLLAHVDGTLAGPLGQVVPVGEDGRACALARLLAELAQVHAAFDAGSGPELAPGVAAPAGSAVGAVARHLVAVDGGLPNGGLPVQPAAQGSPR